MRYNITTDIGTYGNFDNLEELIISLYLDYKGYDETSKDDDLKYEIVDELIMKLSNLRDKL